jgi:DNA-binding transcriptional ArsR family regulator
MGARVLYAMLQSRCIEKRTTFATAQTLAEDIGVSIRAVTGYLAELTARRLVNTRHRGRGRSALRTLADLEKAYAQGELHRGLHRDSAKHDSAEHDSAEHVLAEHEGARETRTDVPGEVVVTPEFSAGNGGLSHSHSTATANGVPTSRDGDKIAAVLGGFVRTWRDAGRDEALPRVREEFDANPISLRAYAEGVDRDRVAGAVRVPWTCLAKRLRNGYSPSEDDWAAARFALNGPPGQGGDAEELGTVFDEIEAGHADR